MTEYDYSPAAAQQFAAQQARVSKWVSHTTAHAHSYSDPFTPSPTLRDRSFYDEPGRTSHRPPPTRSKTLNLPYPKQVDPYIHSRTVYNRERGRSRSLENRSSSSSAKPRSSRSTSHTTPTSSNHKLPTRPYTVKVVYPPPHPPPHQSHQHTQSYSYQKRPQPVRQHTSPAYYYPGESHGPRQRPSYLPPPRPGQTYFIPRGRVEHWPPAPKKPQPLLKRLFGFMGDPNHEREKLRRTSRKRSSY